MSTLVIRADATAGMGAGHVMRSIGLAHAWQAAGGDVVLACAECPDGLVDRARGDGIDVVRLDTEPGTAEDAARTLAVADQRGATWTMLDGYHLGPEMRRTLRSTGRRLLVVDDFGHTRGGEADLILDQNLGATPTPYAAVGCDTLIGPTYALLRREFLSASRREKSSTARSTVLVTFGGSDPDDATALAVEAIAPIPGLEVDVLLGASNPRRAAIEALGARSASVVRVHQNVADVPRFMAAADVAITGGGSTVWELAYFGLPALLVVLAENQRGGAEACEERGLAHCLGSLAGLSAATLRSELEALLGDGARRSAMSAAGRAMVDGRGASRVVAEMRRRSLRLRPAAGGDAELLFRWANEPEVRKQSFSSADIPWEDHVRWFAKKLPSPAARFYVGMDGQQPVGLVRFDLEGTVATIGVSLDAAARGGGLGSALIDRGVGELLATSDVSEVRAYVKLANTPSRAAFLRAGFQEVPDDGTGSEPRAVFVRRR